MARARNLPKQNPAEFSGAGLRGRLHGLATRNLSLKLFALALALTMWAYVASQRRGESAEVKFTTRVILTNIPKNLEVTSSIGESVAVLVKVRRDVARTINPNQFQIGIDLRNQLPGTYEISLSKRNLIYKNENNPPGVEVLQISPSRITLRLEPTYQKEVPIKPRFAGDLAKGFTIESIRIIPPLAKVRGPRSLMDELASVPTRPLDVQDLKNDVEMLVRLDVPERVRMDVPEGTIFKALITVSNNPTRVLLRDIPIVFENPRYSYKASISILNVHLEGPKEAMDSLDRKDVFAVVDLSRYAPGDYRGLAPRIAIPDTVKVLEQWPILDLFVLKRKLPPGGPANSKRPTSRAPRGQGRRPG